MLCIRYLHKAIDENRTSVDVLKKTVYQTLMQKLLVGLFDPINSTEFRKYKVEDINTTVAQTRSYEAALQGMVFTILCSGLFLKLTPGPS